MSEVTGETTVAEQGLQLAVLRDDVRAQVDRELERPFTSDSYVAMAGHLRRCAVLADALAAADDLAEGRGLPWVAEDDRVPSAIRLLRAYALEG